MIDWRASLMTDCTADLSRGWLCTEPYWSYHN